MKPTNARAAGCSGLALGNEPHSAIAASYRRPVSPETGAHRLRPISSPPEVPPTISVLGAEGNHRQAVESDRTRGPWDRGGLAPRNRSSMAPCQGQEGGACRSHKVFPPPPRHGRQHRELTHQHSCQSCRRKTAAGDMLTNGYRAERHEKQPQSPDFAPRPSRQVHEANHSGKQVGEARITKCGPDLSMRARVLSRGWAREQAHSQRYYQCRSDILGEIHEIFPHPHRIRPLSVELCHLVSRHAK